MESLSAALLMSSYRASRSAMEWQAFVTFSLTVRPMPISMVPSSIVIMTGNSSPASMAALASVSPSHFFMMRFMFCLSPEFERFVLDDDGGHQHHPAAARPAVHQVADK